MRITLLSDNHSYFHEEIMPHILDSDEVWHAGDIGDPASVAPIKSHRTFRAVYGNIDDHLMRLEYPKDLIWEVDGLKIYMTHIGGYPGKYSPSAREIILKEKPNVFICGHSHICKVMQDKTHSLLHMNPGAYGHHGFHHVRTILRFEITSGKILNLRVVELGLRGRI